jgi:hypothetical protein
MVTDNDNDFIWTSLLLSRCGYNGANYNQSTGAYRGAFIHTGSFKRGAYYYSFEEPYDKPWEECETFKTYTLLSCHDHNPENDAMSILNEWFAVRAYSKKTNRKEGVIGGEIIGFS